MKKLILKLQVIAVFILISCSEHSEVSPIQEELVNITVLDPVEFNDAGKNAPTDYRGTSTSGSFPSKYDASGRIETRVFWKKYSLSNNQTNKSCTVGTGYVCVGGGAWADYSNGPGALLTASYPSINKETWYASSKDHGYPNDHYIYVYAIGMKIQGISESTLKSYVNISSSTSGSSQDPIKYQSIPNGYIRLSGGARLNFSGPGLLLVNSMPTGSGWHGQGKDHIYYNAGTVTTYSVSLRSSIPNFGNVVSHIFYASSNPGSNGKANVTINVNGLGYAQTGVGGQAFAGEPVEPGRLLTGMIPRGYNATCYSKDHGFSDKAQPTRIYSIGIKKL